MEITHITKLIRKATPEDAPSLAQVLRELGWFQQPESESLAATETRLKAYLELSLHDSQWYSVYVAENKQGQVVGYSAVHWLPYMFLAGPEGYVSELFVLAEARGQGIGRQLLQAVCAEAHQRGCSRLSLLNNRTRESYQRGFYKKLGWVEREAMANLILPVS